MASFFRKWTLSSYYAISVLLVVLVIPVFIVSGAGEGVDQGFEKSGLPFNTDLVTWVRVVAAHPPAWLGAALAILQVASPDIAVFIVMAIGFGAGPLRDLFGRFRFWSAEVPAGRGILIWVLCVAVFAGMSVSTGVLSERILVVDSFEWAPKILYGGLPLGFLIAMFLDGGALFEENGWRGFALPRLLARYKPVGASVALGVLWAIWHVPVKFDLALEYGAPRFAGMFAVLILKFVCLSIIITYFWSLTGRSTIIAIAMHGLSNDSMRLGGLATAENFSDQLGYEINLVIPLAAVSAILILATRGSLGVTAQGEHLART